MGFLREIGRTARLALASACAFPSVLGSRDARSRFLAQLNRTAIGTLPVLTLVSLFTGMILALQLGLELRRFSQEIYLGAAVMVTLLREMGPFACGICLAACAGSAIAAELGTMKVNDEVAALEIMSIPPARFLAAPRVLALTLMSPLLAFYCCLFGTVGGGIVAATQLDVSFGQYMSSAMTMAVPKDLWCGLAKATVFGFTIGTVSVAQGFGAELGATGVGRATQRSVVISFLLILMLGYVLTRLCYS